VRVASSSSEHSGRPTSTWVLAACDLSGQSAHVSDASLHEPWLRPTDAEASRLEVEAQAEFSEGHELFGVGLTAIARCAGCDDVAFRCADDTFAIVHLSYTHHDRPPWPDTMRFGSFIALELAMDQHAH